jgi:hypothetical protein
MRGFTELRVSDETLQLLAIRQVELVQVLLHRGHASHDKIRLNTNQRQAKQVWTGSKLPAPLERAKANPDWSRLNGVEPSAIGLNAARLGAKNELARLLEMNFKEPAPGTTGSV